MLALQVVRVQRGRQLAGRCQHGLQRQAHHVVHPRQALHDTYIAVWVPQPAAGISAAGCTLPSAYMAAPGTMKVKKRTADDSHRMNQVHGTLCTWHLAGSAPVSEGHLQDLVVQADHAQGRKEAEQMRAWRAIALALWRSTWHKGPPAGPHGAG